METQRDSTVRGKESEIYLQRRSERERVGERERVIYRGVRKSA